MTNRKQFSAQERRTILRYIDKINILAVRDQRLQGITCLTTNEKSPISDEEAIVLQFYPYPDGPAVRLRDQLTDSTVFIVSNPVRRLPVILALVRYNMDIVRAVPFSATLNRAMRPAQAKKVCNEVRREWTERMRRLRIQDEVALYTAKARNEINGAAAKKRGSEPVPKP